MIIRLKSAKHDIDLTFFLITGLEWRSSTHDPPNLGIGIWESHFMATEGGTGEPIFAMPGFRKCLFKLAFLL